MHKRNEGTELFRCDLKEDCEDEQDYCLVGNSIENIPPAYSNMSKYVLGVKSQGAVGSCASHAFASEVEIILKQQKPRWYLELSELFHYHTTRVREGTFPNDKGMTLREGAKTLREVGICPEVLWKYDIGNLNTQPNLVARALARFWKIDSYYRLLDKDSIKRALCGGIPVVMGSHIHNSFMYSTDNVPMPEEGELYRGGHAMLYIGHDDKRKAFLTLNSWGTSWGDKGYSWIPYKFHDKYVFDCWCVSIR